MPEITPEFFQDETRATALIRSMVPLIQTDPNGVVQFCFNAIRQNRFLAAAYPILVGALDKLGNHQGREQFGPVARDSGLALIMKGEIEAGAAFFAEVADTFPDYCRPYYLLYSQIKALTAAYRSMRFPRLTTPPTRRLMVSITLWGPRYVDMFTRYFIPSLLAPNNVPALARIREVHFDVYTTAEELEAVRNAPSIQELARHAQVQFTLFSLELLTSPEYKRTPEYRYRLYGGFHHLSVERARALEADLICINPDSVYSDGSLTHYARLVDQGCSAVLGTAMRGQAETLLPRLDQLRDPVTGILALAPRQLVDIDLQNIHHAYKGFFLTKGNRDLPKYPSVLVFPHDRGVYMRCLHIHPMIFSAETLQRNILFDYFTLDSNAFGRFFPCAEDWERVKVVQDSDDGFVMDLSYSYDEGPPQNREFTLEHLREGSGVFSSHNFWSFTHRINFHGDTPIDAIGTFDRLPDGTLQPKLIPVASKIDLSDEEVATWFEANRPK